MQERETDIGKFLLLLLKVRLERVSETDRGRGKGDNEDSRTCDEVIQRDGKSGSRRDLYKRFSVSTNGRWLS